MNLQEAIFDYALRMGDNALILGQRLGEWCGYGPVLEQDIAVTNLALDQVGQARSWLSYAGEVEGKGRSEDDLAYWRKEHEFRNNLLVEQPNDDWAHTLMRQFLFDVYNFFLHKELVDSKDDQISAIAEKSLKEITYHLRYSSEWVIRLGDGTDLSHEKMQAALDKLWRYSGELTENTPTDLLLAEEGIAPNLETIQPLYDERVQTILKEATLTIPEDTFMQKGGRKGIHTEYMGYILAEMQSVQRTYPGLEW